MNVARHPFVQAINRHFPGAQVSDAWGYVRIPRTAPEQGKPAPAMPFKNFKPEDLAASARAEADRLRVVQAALVAAGDREEVDADRMLRADHFDALARLADKVGSDAGLQARLRAIAAASVQRQAPASAAAAEEPAGDDQAEEQEDVDANA